MNVIRNKQNEEDIEYYAGENIEEPVEESKSAMIPTIMAESKKEEKPIEKKETTNTYKIYINEKDIGTLQTTATELKKIYIRLIDTGNLLMVDLKNNLIYQRLPEKVEIILDSSPTTIKKNKTIWAKIWAKIRGK